MATRKKSEAKPAKKITRKRRPWAQRASQVMQNAIRFAGALSNDEDAREAATEAVAALKPLCEFLESCPDDYKQSTGGRGTQLMVGMAVMIKEKVLGKPIGEGYHAVAKDEFGERIVLEIAEFFGPYVLLTHDGLDGKKFPAQRSHVEPAPEDE